MSDLNSIKIPIIATINSNPIAPTQSSNLNVGYLCAKFNEIITAFEIEINQLKSKIHFLENYLPALKLELVIDFTLGQSEYSNVITNQKIGNLTRYSVEFYPNPDNVNPDIYGDEFVIVAVQDIPNGRMYFVESFEMYPYTDISLSVTNSQDFVGAKICFYIE